MIQTGMAALGLGTYGAHAFKPNNPTYKDVIFILPPRFLYLQFICVNCCFLYVCVCVIGQVWHTASLYHLVHTAALVAAPLTTHPHIVSFFYLFPSWYTFLICLCLDDIFGYCCLFVLVWRPSHYWNSCFLRNVSTDFND